MKRNGFTVVELIICVVIVGILAAIVFGAAGCGNDYDVKTTGTYRCVTKYTKGGGENEDSKRVDLAPEDGGPNITVECDDSWRAGVSNSGELYAQFEEKKWYKVTFVGKRKTGWNSYFPLVKSVEKVEPPAGKE